MLSTILAVPMALTDEGLIAFGSTLVVLVLGLITLYLQNRDQGARLDDTTAKLGTPNGGGSIAADVHALTDLVTELAETVATQHESTETRLDRIDAALGLE